MPIHKFTSPEGVSYYGEGETPEEAFRVAQELEPNELAAMRQRQAVKPSGGRQEGAATEWTISQGQKISTALTDTVKHPENIVATGELGGMVNPIKGGRLGLSLRQTGRDQDRTKTVHDFDIVLPSGEKLGVAKISEQHLSGLEDHLYVDHIGSDGGPQSLGTSQAREILSAIKERFPNARSISGERYDSGTMKGRGSRNTGMIPLNTGGNRLPQPSVGLRSDRPINQQTIDEMRAAEQTGVNKGISTVDPRPINPETLAEMRANDPLGTGPLSQTDPLLSK
jgi:hypothetical protein